MPRPRSVISPPLPSRTKPKAVADKFADWRPFPGRAFRVRPTDELPFGGFEPSTYFADEFDAEMLAADLLAEGTACMVERAIPGGWSV